ncbi:LEPR-XLL domain-containing protein [Acinetobacter bouvetii]|uniref:LEPR-XLL domain-containing protein n=1 Tax=Acinetobacter bouvetii TaxID=202951 RepID=A0A4Q7APC5_9GAMM|nr:LEPR-XLL domain-containing protein [Acinetobacter bouvetii]TCB72977.1 LEPR-XLL domain-containing protein [Acinetobacter sp. ANC 4177]
MYDNNKFRYTKLFEALEPKFLYSGTNKNCNFT